MKLSDIKGEKALEVLGDIIEPICEIAADDGIKKVKERKGAKNVDVAAYIIKQHRHAVISILASVNLKSYEEYLEEINLVKLPMDVLELINDPQVLHLFQLQSQNPTEDSFGSATENTEAHGK